MSQGTRALASMAVACGLIAGGIALAQGPDMNLPVFGVAPGSPSYYSPFYSEPSPARYEDGGDIPRPKSRHRSGGFGYGQPICVRLCDGAFFPTSAVADGEATCAAQCPDAPTALYT